MYLRLSLTFFRKYFNLNQTYIIFFVSGKSSKFLLIKNQTQTPVAGEFW